MSAELQKALGAHQTLQRAMSWGQAGGQGGHPRHAHHCESQGCPQQDCGRSERFCPSQMPCLLTADLLVLAILPEDPRSLKGLMAPVLRELKQLLLLVLLLAVQWDHRTACLVLARELR